MSTNHTLWRKNNPEKRKEQKKREKIRKALRELSYLPPVGEELNDEQKIIENQISNNDFTFWESIKFNEKIKSRHPKKQTIYQIVLNKIKEESKKNEKIINLNDKEFQIPSRCFFLGTEIDYKNKNSENYFVITLINIKGNYDNNNIRIITKKAQKILESLSKEELLFFGESIFRSEFVGKGPFSEGVIIHLKNGRS